VLRLYLISRFLAVPLGRQALQVRKVIQGLRVLKVLPVKLALQAQPVLMGQMEPQQRFLLARFLPELQAQAQQSLIAGHLPPPSLISPFLKVLLGRPAPLGQRDHRDHKEKRAPQARLVLKVKRDHRARQDQQALTVLTVLMAQTVKAFQQAARLVKFSRKPAARITTLNGVMPQVADLLIIRSSQAVAPGRNPVA